MPGPSLEQRRKRAVWYLEKLLTMGISYMWGGDDPMAGFDCSGQVVEILQGAGLEVHGYDNTANGLYLKYKPNTIEEGKAGALVFWLKDGKAKHVEMMIDEYHTVGASGGGQPQFNIYNEVRKCPFLMSYYGMYTREQLQDLENTFFLKFIKAELYRQQAIDQNAYLKLRPIEYRGPHYKICDPFKEME